MNALAETCLPLEDIAAFLDHMMAGEERDRVVTHLAGCEACYGVFADSARFQLEESGELEEEPREAAREAPAPARVIPLRRGGAPRWALPFAATLILGVAALPLYLSSRKPEMLSAELVDPAALQNVPTDSVWNQDKRGGGEPSALDQSPFEFLVGVHLVDLRFTLARGDKDETLNVLARINGHMNGLFLVEEQAGFYEKSVGDLHEGRRTLSEVSAEAARVEAELTEYYEEYPHLAFGKWTEAGRLSAKGRNPAFFEDRDNRRFPGWLLRNAEEDLGEEVAPTVKRIRGLLEDSDPSSLPYEALEKQFEAILLHYQRQADASSSSF